MRLNYFGPAGIKKHTISASCMKTQAKIYTFECEVLSKHNMVFSVTRMHGTTGLRPCKKG